MKYKALTLFSLFGFVLLTSCKKEESMEILSNAELIANELTQVIEDNNISRVLDWEIGSSWSNTSIFGNYGSDYKFTGQFVYIEGEYFNLNNLIKYEIEEKNEVNFLLLSFY